MQLQTTSPESKFPNEYIGVILFKSINIWKSYWKNTKGSRFYGTRCTTNHCLLFTAHDQRYIHHNLFSCSTNIMSSFL